MKKLLPAGYDKLLNLAVIILSIFGTIMIASASMGLNIGDNKYLIITVAKQIIFVLAGFAAMTLLANRFTISYLKSKYFLYIVLITVFSLLACLLFSPVGGAKAWIRIPLGITEISLQPSEFAKVSVILIVAAYCGETKRIFESNWKMIKRPFWIIAIICGIVSVLQGDFGSMAVIAVIAYQCFQIPSHPQMKRFQTVLAVFFILLLIIFVYILLPLGEGIIKNVSFFQEYQKNRFMSAIDPFYDQYNTGFQLIKGLISFAIGGWFGKGLGHSVNKYSQFPAANTDYILAILVEELGFVGFLFLFLLYGTIMFKCYSYALRIKSECGKIILVGTATYLLVHTLLNVGGVTGLIPLTGVPLIMISAGGSSTIAFMMSIGICQSVISSFNNGKLK